MLPGPPEMEERYRRFLDGRGDDVVPLFCCLRNGRQARVGTEAWAALILSRIYLLRGAIDLASAHLRIAARRSGGAPEALRLGILVNRALVIRARGRGNEAASLLRAIVDRALRSREMLVAAKGASNNALALARLGMTAEACSYAGLAERLYQSMRNGEGLARTNLVRAVIEIASGRSDEAIARLAAILRELTGRERERERLTALLLLGEAYVARREFDRASQALEGAGAMKGALALFPPQRARLLELRHALHLNAGEGDAARECSWDVERMRRARGMRSHAAGAPDAAGTLYPIEPGGAGEPAAEAQERVVALTTAEGPEETFLTSDAATARILARLRKAARIGTPLLLRGESGVGKDLLARLAHRWSGREREPFVPVNVASVPEDLFESVFFGHSRGAFTGAIRRAEGLVAAAGRGTLFLDEIGELPRALQPKLLRFIDSGEYYMLGEISPRRSRARVVCATNRDLEAACEAGEFRRDLYHRIAALSFGVPPLRERRGDIPLLAFHLLERARIRYGLGSVRVDPDAQAALAAYDWPGNARELEAVLIEAALRSCGGLIRTVDLPWAILASPGSAIPPEGDLRTRERSQRRERIVAALRECDGNRTRAAALLGLKRTTLIGIMKRLEIA